MNRRDAILVLASLGIAPITLAQRPSKPARIGILVFGSPEGSGPFVDAFKLGMRELGYSEGTSVTYDIRWASGRPERLPALAKELVSLNPDVIWTGAPETALAVQSASIAIPIVAGDTGGDAVRSGLAKSLARPGGNITGFAAIYDDYSAKLLELLLGVEPKPALVAILRNPASPTVTNLESLQTAAARMGVSLLTLEARNPAQIEDAFRRMIEARVSGAILLGGPMFFQQRPLIAELALSSRVPTIYPIRVFVDAGGLMSYGAHLSDNYRRSATYVDRILKGANPGDLPIQQSTKFELVINLKTAKAIGVTIPQSLLLRADEVIQ